MTEKGGEINIDVRSKTHRDIIRKIIKHRREEQRQGHKGSCHTIEQRELQDIQSKYTKANKIWQPSDQISVPTVDRVGQL